MDEPINYTRVDMERYLNHQMTKGEMHAFEIAMMDDPFLADALEGYRDADQQISALHLTEIENNIKTQKAPPAILPLTQKANNWWRVAAIFLLVTGSGSLYYFSLLSKHTSTELAANNTLLQQVDSIGPEVKQVETPQLFFKKDNALARNNNTPIFNKSQPEEANVMAATAPVIDSTYMSSNQSMAALKNSEGNGLTEAAPQTRLMRKSEAEAVNIPTYEFAGKVLDEDGDPVAFATVSSKKGVGAVTDSKGNFSIKTPDSIIDVTIAGMGYLPVTARLHHNQAQDFQLLENKKDLSDLVVSSMGKKKKFDVTIDKNEYLNKETGYKPLKGWRHLNNYLLININDYREASEEYISGDVEIEFEINKNGRPVVVRVVDASDHSNAEKAIELIQKGPLWKKGKPGIKARLLVSF